MMLIGIALSFALFCAFIYAVALLLIGVSRMFGLASQKFNSQESQGIKFNLRFFFVDDAFYKISHKKLILVSIIIAAVIFLVVWIVRS